MPDRRVHLPAEGRLWLIPVSVLAVAAASFILYNTSPPAVANVVIFPYAISLILGPSFIYPWLRWRRVSTPRAIAASLCVPALWLLKECYCCGTVFSLAETIFFAFNPLSLGLCTGAALQMGLSELVLRRLQGGRWELFNGAGLVTAAILAVGASFGAIARIHGASILFWTYIEVYRYLFRD